MHPELKLCGQGDYVDEEVARLDRELTAKGSPNVGALIIRIGLWGFLIIIIVQYPPKPYSNY